MQPSTYSCWKRGDSSKWYCGIVTMSYRIDRLISRCTPELRAQWRWVSSWDGALNSWGSRSSTNLKDIGLSRPSRKSCEDLYSIVNQRELRGESFMISENTRPSKSYMLSEPMWRNRSTNLLDRRLRFRNLRRSISRGHSSGWRGMQKFHWEVNIWGIKFRREMSAEDLGFGWSSSTRRINSRWIWELWWRERPSKQSRCTFENGREKLTCSKCASSCTWLSRSANIRRQITKVRSRRLAWLLWRTIDCREQSIGKFMHWSGPEE